MFNILITCCIRSSIRTNRDRSLDSLVSPLSLASLCSLVSTMNLFVGGNININESIGSLLGALFNNYLFRRRSHFLNLNSFDDTETVTIMVRVAVFEKKTKVISFAQLISTCAVLTLLFVWQHVALMHPSSVVGQSSAQPSCDPFAFKLFDKPSEYIEMRLEFRLHNFELPSIPHT